MGSFRFVHVADVHLDTAFAARREDLRRRLREAARESFRRAVDLTLRSKAHALLIAGDLFDQERISFATERFLAEQLARLREGGVAVFYACGNHDPGGLENRLGNEPWPEGAVFADGNPTLSVLRTPGGDPLALVSGAGHRTARERGNLVASFAKLKGQIEGRGLRGLPHVGLVHAWVHRVAGDDDHDRYAPCTAHDLQTAGRAAGIGYWALGHIHQRQQVGAEPLALYPGNLMGRSFKEEGPKGAYVVDMDGAGVVRAEFHPLAPVRWETVTVDDLQDVRASGELEERIVAACRRRQADSGHAGEWLWRIRLQGPCPLAQRLGEGDNLRELEEELAEGLDALYLEVRAGDLTPVVDLDLYRDGIHPLAVALDLLRRAEEDEELLDQLIPSPLAAALAGDLDGSDPAAQRAYVRELLAGLDKEAAARLLDPDRHGMGGNAGAVHFPAH